MSVTHAPGRSVLRRRGRRHRPDRAAVRRRRGRDPRRHGRVRRAGLPRPGPRRRAAAGLHPRAWATSSTPSARACARRTTIACRRRSPTCPTWTRTTRRSPATTAGGCSPSATGCGTPTARSRSMPAKYSLLRAVQRPVEGRQHRVRRHARGLRCARRTRPRTEVEDLVCEHSQIYSRQQLGFTDFTDEERERFKPVRQRLVRTHPSTGASRSTSPRMPAASSAGRCPRRARFLRDLIEHATQRQFVYAHKWRVGDLVMWDNRQTMHRARPFPPTSRATCAARRSWATGRLFYVGGPEGPPMPHATRPGGAVALRER